MDENLSDDARWDPLDATIREQMERATYRSLRDLWEKANDRLIDDPNGAITVARSLLEATCKKILAELSIEIEKGASLPQLYDTVCKTLGMVPRDQLDPSFRAVFSSAAQIVNSVAEMRNRKGDSHGRADPLRASNAEAQLAVNIAGSVAVFVAARYEGYLNARQRLTKDGKAILRFDKSMVWRLVDHATNSPKSKLSLGENVGRCLLLVGDSGIYLMSNGDPPIYLDGTLLPGTSDQPKMMLTAEAEGCGAFSDIEDWSPIHRALGGGGDFAETIPIEKFREVLWNSHSSIVIVADLEQYEVVSDVEFDKRGIESR